MSEGTFSHVGDQLFSCRNKKILILFCLRQHDCIFSRDIVDPVEPVNQWSVITCGQDFIFTFNSFIV